MLDITGTTEVECDRKTCIALDLKVSGANRELAQWLLDHHYSNRVVGAWLGCAYSRVAKLRKWARNGFNGTPFDLKNQPDKRSGPGRAQPSLESLDNFDDGQTPPSYLGYDESDLAALANADAKERDTEVADAATIEDNVIYSLQRMNEHAKMFRKLFKASAFDREAQERISTAIDRMIQKWRSTQATLTRRSKSDGEAQA